MMDVFLGQIQTFAFPFAPVGWAPCNGATMSISQNPALAALLQTTYGGDGTTTFGLPDLRGRAMIGQGQGPGLQPYNIGQTGGAPEVTLTQSNMPYHTHPLMAATGASTSASAAGNLLASPGGTDSIGNPVAVTVYAPAGAGAMTAMSSLSIGPAVGGSVPFSILPPFQTVNVCIAIQGNFPTRG